MLFCPRKRILHLAILTIAVCTFLAACTGPQPPSGEHSARGFDYYVLALSWAPQFCAKSARGSSLECDPDRSYGLVVHGLWPQNDNGSYPANCSPARPVDDETVRRMLAIMPSRGLIHHEWAEHGTCTGLDARTYFGELQRSFAQLHIPAEYRAPAQPIQVSPTVMEQAFADANHAPAGAFHVACSGGEFAGVDVCLTEKLQYRRCGAGVRECRARAMTVRPLR